MRPLTQYLGGRPPAQFPAACLVARALCRLGTYLQPAGKIKVMSTLISTVACRLRRLTPAVAPPISLGESFEVPCDRGSTMTDNYFGSCSPAAMAELSERLEDAKEGAAAASPAGRCSCFDAQRRGRCHGVDRAGDRRRPVFEGSSARLGEPISTHPMGADIFRSASHHGLFDAMLHGLVGDRLPAAALRGRLFSRPAAPRLDTCSARRQAPSALDGWDRLGS